MSYQRKRKDSKDTTLGVGCSWQRSNARANTPKLPVHLIQPKTTHAWEEISEATLSETRVPFKTRKITRPCDEYVEFIYSQTRGGEGTQNEKDSFGQITSMPFHKRATLPSRSTHGGVKSPLKLHRRGVRYVAVTQYGVVLQVMGARWRTVDRCSSTDQTCHVLAY